MCLQNNCISQPVVYLDNMLDHEMASKLTAIIVKHQVICCDAEDEQIEQIDNTMELMPVLSWFLLPPSSHFIHQLFPSVDFTTHAVCTDWAIFILYIYSYYVY